MLSPCRAKKCTSLPDCMLARCAFIFPVAYSGGTGTGGGTSTTGDFTVGRDLYVVGSLYATGSTATIKDLYCPGSAYFEGDTEFGSTISGNNGQPLQVGGDGISTAGPGGFGSVTASGTGSFGAVTSGTGIFGTGIFGTVSASSTGSFGPLFVAGPSTFQGTIGGSSGVPLRVTADGISSTGPGSFGSVTATGPAGGSFSSLSTSATGTLGFLRVLGTSTFLGAVSGPQFQPLVVNGDLSVVGAGDFGIVTSNTGSFGGVACTGAGTFDTLAVTSAAVKTPALSVVGAAQLGAMPNHCYDLL